MLLVRGPAASFQIVVDRSSLMRSGGVGLLDRGTPNFEISEITSNRGRYFFGVGVDEHVFLSTAKVSPCT